MTRPAPRHKKLEIVATSLLVLAVTAAVAVAGPASASPAATTTKKKTTTTKQAATTKATTTATQPTATTTLPDATIPRSPADRYFVLNGTANAASDHEIVGSSAFPNFTTGAVDNYYAMAHTHVDNSPFAEGTASPADTGPVGQTAAAGNVQQPQYADSRWPGDPAKASYGNQGGPYATSTAGEYKATADASEATNGFDAPGGPSKLAAPKGFDLHLREALAAWKAKWQHRPSVPAKPVSTPTLTPPAATIPSPAGTVTTPSVTVPGLNAPSPPPPVVTVPVPTVTTLSMRSKASGTRSLASASSTQSTASGDGMSLLESSTTTYLDPKTDALVTSGESRLGRVSLGGGQIVIEGIHVTASISNDGTPANKVSVSVASATIGGVPVTIDQDGVHLAGQGQGIPYKQASDALNGALKQAGIQLFLVGPEITTSTCDQSGSTPGGGSGGGTTTESTTTNSTTTSSSDQSGAGPGSGCDQSSSCTQGSSGSGGGGTTTTPLTPGTTTTSTRQTSTTSTTSTTSSCDTGSCSSTSMTGGTTPTSTTTAATTTSSGGSGTMPTPSSCDQTGMTSTTPVGTCAKKGATTTTTSANDQASTTGTTDTTTTADGMDTAPGSAGSGEETLIATGLHVVFVQPVNQSGVPSQNVEHILGEVYLDSLATPAGPVPKLDLNFGLDFGSASGSGFGSSSGASGCPGSHFGQSNASSGGAGGAGLSAGGSSLAGTPSGFSGAAGAEPVSGTAGSPLVSSLRGLGAMLRTKPLWVLIAFLTWQAIAFATGASLWHWRKEEGL